MLYYYRYQALNFCSDTIKFGQINSLIVHFCFLLNSFEVNEYLKAIVNHVLLIRRVFLLLFLHFFDFWRLWSDHRHLAELLAFSSQIVLLLHKLIQLPLLLFIFLPLLLVVFQLLLSDLFLEHSEPIVIHLFVFFKFLQMLKNHLFNFIQHGHFWHVVQLSFFLVVMSLCVRFGSNIQLPSQVEEWGVDVVW